MKVTRCIIALAGVVVLTGCHNKQPQIENIVTVKTATASSAALGTQQNYAGSIEEQSGTIVRNPLKHAAVRVIVSQMRRERFIRTTILTDRLQLNHYSLPH